MLDFLDNNDKSFLFGIGGLMLFVLILGFVWQADWNGITEWWYKTEITVKSENGDKFHSYQAACEASDYAAAHSYVIKMEEASHKDRTITDST